MRWILYGIVDNCSFLQQKAPPAKQHDCRFAGGVFCVVLLVGLLTSAFMST
jgi:hypothetical protein